jgi:hypothetical protein
VDQKGALVGLQGWKAGRAYTFDVLALKRFKNEHLISASSK